MGMCPTPSTPRQSKVLSGSTMTELFWWCRIRGTVITTLWWKILLLLIYTFIIVFVHSFICHLDFPQTLIPILGVVVGLLLGFRTNSAYDRYWEGRKLWTSMTQDVRKLTRCIWAGVEEVDLKSIIEKKSALNLVVAFVVATKHYLREEYSDQYDDLKTLIAHLPRFKSSISNLRHADDGNRHVSRRESRQARGFKLIAYDQTTPTNIPIEISYYLLSYIKHISSSNVAPPWAISSMQASLSNLVDSLANFERILRTPIPMAYSIHLHISVWLYILSLPFQIVGTVGWMTLVVVGLGSFCLLGILSVAYEIENPFGYDENDLPLDDFCHAMRVEMDMITGSRMLHAAEWIYAKENKPFFPTSDLSTERLLSLTKEDLTEILVRSKDMHTCEDVEENEEEKSKDN